MGRLIKIAIYALIILILYFWVTAILKSYARKNVKETAQTEQLDSLASDTISDYFTNQDSEYDGDEKLISNQDIVDGKIDYNEVDQKVKELESKKEVQKTIAKDPVATAVKKEEKPKPSVPTTKIDNKSAPKTVKGDGGKYMVMAGSYLLKDNAKKMVSKLKTMGYPNAELVIFTSSEYHSVVAAKFSSESEARAASDQLRKKGIESFIKQK